MTEGVKWLLNGTLLLGPYPFARSFKGARPSYELLSRLISIGVCGPTTIMRFSTAMHHSLYDPAAVCNAPLSDRCLCMCVLLLQA